ncbi:EamA family transporter RarD [Thermobispora bispora]|uniref:EamA family transporter RarD n=1 Tax=Thermobispora bispora TaxID=2006 RepID=UPI00197F215A|nr:EamA family transporter RarD [Thermobispora bispora]QSI47005.1 EamA family transporter RarD [Thermobispora bispora]
MPELRRGVAYGVAAYAIWGLTPLYWPLLEPSGAVEILAHRMVWSLVVVAALLAVRRRWSWIRELTGRQVLLLAIAAIVVSVNWGVYIYAVNSGHVVDASLGYFINPLVNVLFGIMIFGERLRTGQWVAVGLGTLAVAVLTYGYGQPPWIALVLAFTFGIYGVVKKKARVEGTESLAVETLVMLLPAVVYLGTLHASGEGTFGRYGLGHALLVAGAGVVTALPLIFFTIAALSIPLSLVGLLQYIAPILQFLCGVLIAHETMPPSRWAGFCIVWLALAVFTWDTLRAARNARLAREAEPATV